MTTASLVEMCEAIARAVHAGQVDKSGEPYIEHCRRVAEAMEGPTEKSVAWLHDAFEDGFSHAYRLMNGAGLPAIVIERVFTLSKRVREPYAYYIERIATCGDAVVVAVKLADLRDNLRPGAESLRSRYLKAIKRLELAKDGR